MGIEEMGVQGIFEHLNGSDALLAPVDETQEPTEAARRRVLGRLGEYTAQVVAPLNMRPKSATLLCDTAERVEVRISTDSAHVVLVIAPDGDLAGELFFLRAMAIQRLPAHHVIGHDLSKTAVPFTYLLLNHIGGSAMDRLSDPVLIQVAARHVGRALRRLHSYPAPGFGRPTLNGRWPARTWIAALSRWLGQQGFWAHSEAVLGGDLAAAVRAATIDHPSLEWGEQPCALHGAASPERAVITTGGTAQLEALTRPGMIVGGDPLFDLAYGTLPRHPEPFRRGLLEGYAAAGLLDAHQRKRLDRLWLLLYCADTLAQGSPAAQAALPDTVADVLRSVCDT